MADTSFFQEPSQSFDRSVLAREVPSPLQRPCKLSSASELLDATPWVQLLSGVARQCVYASASETFAHRGAVIARVGDRSTSWVGVREGLLKICSTQRSGRTVMFAGVPAGSWIGEGALLKRERRPYDIVAMRDTWIVHVPLSTFQWLVETSIEFNKVLVMRLNQRLGHFAALAEAGRTNDPAARVARAIRMLYCPILCASTGPLLPLSQTEIGELIGLSRQSVGAALKRLEGLGLVERSYGGILVHDLDRLATYCPEDEARQ